MNIHTKQWNGLDKLVMDSNLYYQRADRVLFWWGERSYQPRDFDTYRKETGKDGGSRVAILTP
jgi:hypothetical protein